VNRELRAFPDGQHDDITDTFAYGYNYFRMIIEKKFAGVGYVTL
jgi:phage terminase large subunit-like protein